MGCWREQLERGPFAQSQKNPHNSKYRKQLKQRIARSERRKAKMNPETVPTYKQFCGWEL